MNTFTTYVAQFKEVLDKLPMARLKELAEQLHQTRLAGKQVFVIGNGGSASTASHLACDLNKNTVVAGLPRFRVLALTDNMAVFSATGNDLGYDNVFAEQLANFVEPGDMLIAISASGNSPNILKAVGLAQQNSAMTVGWSGFDGGKLAQSVDLSIVVPSHQIEQVEDIHLMLAHMVTTAVRQTAYQAYLAKPVEAVVVTPSPANSYTAQPVSQPGLPV
ncbi:MAG TPA: SIS domain-containing protein [Caldilineaceae bacterium]|nr:SIS domain-containing protein [Caldilineaceae bacterium]